MANVMYTIPSLKCMYAARTEADFKAKQSIAHMEVDFSSHNFQKDVFFNFLASREL